MRVAFRSTLRALEAESRGSNVLAWAWPIALLCGWLSWMIWARVPIYASSAHARLEVEAASHRAAAETGGGVLSVHVELGQQVTEGQLILQLDTAVEAKKRAEAEAALSALGLRKLA